MAHDANEVVRLNGLEVVDGHAFEGEVFLGECARCQQDGDQKGDDFFHRGGDFVN